MEKIVHKQWVLRTKYRLTIKHVNHLQINAYLPLHSQESKNPNYNRMESETKTLQNLTVRRKNTLWSHLIVTIQEKVARVTEMISETRNDLNGQPRVPSVN